MRTHLGSVLIRKEELLKARNCQDHRELRLPLQLEREDNPLSNAVGGELIVQYRYADTPARRAAVAAAALEMPLDLTDIPPNFPYAPPAEWSTLSPPVVVDNSESGRAEMKLMIRKKYLRKYWEEQLALYQKKKREGDEEGMTNVVRGVRAELEKPENVELMEDAEKQEASLEFPARPISVPDTFPGDPFTDTEGWKRWKKNKFLMDCWESSWNKYSKYKEAGDQEGMKAEVEGIKEIFSRHGVNFRRRFSMMVGGSDGGERELTRTASQKVLLLNQPQQAPPHIKTAHSRTRLHIDGTFSPQQQQHLSPQASPRILSPQFFSPPQIQQYQPQSEAFTDSSSSYKTPSQQKQPQPKPQLQPQAQPQLRPQPQSTEEPLQAITHRGGPGGYTSQDESWLEDNCESSLGNGGVEGNALGHEKESRANLPYPSSPEELEVINPMFMTKLDGGSSGNRTSGDYGTDSFMGREGGPSERDYSGKYGGGHGGEDDKPNGDESSEDDGVFPLAALNVFNVVSTGINDFFSGDDDDDDDDNKEAVVSTQSTGPTAGPDYILMEHSHLNSSNTCRPKHHPGFYPHSFSHLLKFNNTNLNLRLLPTPHLLTRRPRSKNNHNQNHNCNHKHNRNYDRNHNRRKNLYRQ
eukprot:TRINITY_DN6172_c0_g1_i2.p1 TRINITY_DN6172_c0_g1~~TRINITY_DN6172_c0_g1_i2.p1  ORF type:complete len:637 (-),score=173.19 TRINITY_DN6172_c0_g1_i2:1372-3282(-)